MRLLSRNRGLRSAAFWTLLAGTAGIVATLLLGILGNPFTDPSSEFTTKTLRHQRMGIIAAAIFGVLCFWRIAREGKMSKAEGVGYGIVLLAGVGLVSYTGYLGGHLLE